eukprot:307175-Hanusia_phi.AAC.6
MSPLTCDCQSSTCYAREALPAVSALILKQSARPCNARRIWVRCRLLANQALLRPRSAASAHPCKTFLVAMLRTLRATSRQEQAASKETLPSRADAGDRHKEVACLELSTTQSSHTPADHRLACAIRAWKQVIALAVSLFRLSQRTLDLILMPVQVYQACGHFLTSCLPSAGGAMTRRWSKSPVERQGLATKQLFFVACSRPWR